MLWVGRIGSQSSSVFERSNQDMIESLSTLSGKGLAKRDIQHTRDTGQPFQTRVELGEDCLRCMITELEKNYFMDRQG